MCCVYYYQLFCGLKLCSMINRWKPFNCIACYIFLFVNMYDHGCLRIIIMQLFSVVYIHFYHVLILSVRAVVVFVRQHLTDPDLKFYLCKYFQINISRWLYSLYSIADTAPPKTILKSSAPTLGEAGFVPAANIHLGIKGEGDSENPQLLSPESLARFNCSAAQAELASTTIRET